MKRREFALSTLAAGAGAAIARWTCRAELVQGQTEALEPLDPRGDFVPDRPGTVMQVHAKRIDHERGSVTLTCSNNYGISLTATLPWNPTIAAVQVGEFVLLQSRYPMSVRLDRLNASGQTVKQFAEEVRRGGR